MVTESDYKTLQEDYRTSSKGDANHHLNYAIRCLDVMDEEQYQLESDTQDGCLHFDYYKALFKAGVITGEYSEHIPVNWLDIDSSADEYLKHIWNPSLFLDDFSLWESIVLDESYLERKARYSDDFSQPQKTGE
jgi:hypothetical protein